jgi:hypothetical protein
VGRNLLGFGVGQVFRAYNADFSRINIENVSTKQIRKINIHNLENSVLIGFVYNLPFSCKLNKVDDLVTSCNFYINNELVLMEHISRLNGNGLSGTICYGHRGALFSVENAAYWFIRDLE